MIAVTFDTPLLEKGEFLCKKSGTVFHRGWLRAYNPEKGVIFFDDDWDFDFEECGETGVYKFVQKDNCLGLMITATGVKSVEKYERVDATG